MAILKRSKKSILGLDVQLGNIETNIANNSSNLSTEITNRTSGDANLQTQINTEKGRVDILTADVNTTNSVDYKINQATNSLATGDNVYTKAETDSLLSGKINSTLALSTVTLANKVVTETELATKATASNVYTKVETDTFLAGKADATTTYNKTEVDTIVAAKADSTSTYTKTETDALVSPKANSADVYSKTEIDTQLGSVLVDSDTVTAVTEGNKVVTQTELSTKANSSDVYTKSEIDTQNSSNLVDSDTVTAVSVGNKIVTQAELSTKANSADVYTQTQIDSALSGKADSSVAGKVGPSLKIVDETNIADGKVLSYNTVSGNLEYVDQIDTGAVINDSASNLTETYSSSKIDTVLATKANSTDVYTKAEADALHSAASQGLKYTVVDITALNAITGMEQDDQALVDADRYVYKYDTTNGWEQFYAMDATHNHNDLYYTETEVDTALAGKANVGDSYTKAESDTALAAKAPASSAGKVGPSLVTVDETNQADGKVLSFNNSTGNLEYVDQDGSGIINDTTASASTTYSSNKIDTSLSLKADASDVYTKTETDTFNGTVLVDGDTVSTVDGANKIVTETELNLKANVADVYTQSQLDTSLAGKVNTSDVLTVISGVNKVVTEADIVGKADISSVYTKTESDTNLSGKANVGDAYTKAESDSNLAGKLNTTDTVSAVSISNKIITQTELVGLASANDVYTKTETDTLLAPKFEQSNAVSTVDGTNKLVTQTELATKVNVSDVKSTISVGNKVVTETDVAAAIDSNNATLAVAPELVVDRPTMSTKSSSGLDYVFEFALSKTPHGDVCVGDEITIYDFYENGDATVFENVSLFADKHAEIAVTLGDVAEAANYNGKTVKLTYLSTDTAVVPGADAANPIIINAGVNFESQGGGITDYSLDFSAGSYYRVVFADGFYTNINHDVAHTNFHVTNSTDYQAFHYQADDTLKSLSWVGQADEVQYIVYNWEMSFTQVSGATYKISFERLAEVGGGAL